MAKYIDIWDKETEEKRMPMSEWEYKCMLNLFATATCWNKANLAPVEKRLKSVPGAWRDACLAGALTEKLSRELLSTVPSKKLMAMKHECQNSTMRIIIRQSAPMKENGARWVSEPALMEIVNMAMNGNCTLCGKKGSEAKHCRLRKALDEMYEFDVGHEKGKCAYAGMVVGEVKDEQTFELVSEDVLKGV